MENLVKHTYVIGDEVSYGFNGDWYPAGKVTKLTAKFLTTERGGKFSLHLSNYREYNDALGKSVDVKREVFRSVHGGTWLLTKGIVEAQNPHF